VSYAEITSTHGHDSFLMPHPHYFDVMQAYLDNIHRENAA
jgi:homoserine O-acetyltransferase